MFIHRGMSQFGDTAQLRFSPSASRNCHTSSPVRVGLCPGYQISTRGVPSFTALCLLLPVALSRDHERNGVRIKNRAERSEQT